MVPLLSPNNLAFTLNHFIQHNGPYLEFQIIHQPVKKTFPLPFFEDSTTLTASFTCNKS